jgi:hypothetical protein
MGYQVMYRRDAALAGQEPCVPRQTLIHDVAEMAVLATEPKWPLNVVSPPGLAADCGSNDGIIECPQASGRQGFNIPAGHFISDITAAKIKVIAYAVAGIPSIWPK